MKKLTKWIKVEKTQVNDYVREQRYIVTTHSIFGLPIYKKITSRI